MTNVAEILRRLIVSRGASLHRVRCLSLGKVSRRRGFGRNCVDRRNWISRVARSRDPDQAEAMSTARTDFVEVSTRLCGLEEARFTSTGRPDFVPSNRTGWRALRADLLRALPNRFSGGSGMARCGARSCVHRPNRSRRGSVTDKLLLGPMWSLSRQQM
jgi:hypothetical protein